MEKIYSDQKKSPESGRYNSERLSNQKTAYLGNLAMNKSEFLGINDPLTHLCQYFERGEESVVRIKADLETDIAERLPKTPFINHVEFEFIDNDFVSVKDKVSMKLMTRVNLDVLGKIENNSGISQEIERAEIEAAEVEKLARWYESAPEYSYLIFESLPIGSQKIAISRIYQKQPNSRLQGSFVSLYSPTIKNFNRLRKEFSPKLEDCCSEIDILKNHYDFYAPNLKSADDFIDYYVGAYDKIMFEDSGKQSNFGLPDRHDAKINGLEKIRRQPGLSSVYIEAVKKLADSGGNVSTDLFLMNEKLSLGYPLSVGSKISIETARGFLSDVIRGIASVIDNADNDFLRYLETSNSVVENNYAAVSSYQIQSREMGQSYASMACPEFINNIADSLTKSAGFEQDAMLRAFNIWESIDLFGKPKIDICRTANCPSHGNSKSFKNRTVVGGCGFCVDCHKILQKNKSPEKAYQEKAKKQQDESNKKRPAKNNKDKAA